MIDPTDPDFAALVAFVAKCRPAIADAEAMVVEILRWQKYSELVATEINRQAAVLRSIVAAAEQLGLDVDRPDDRRQDGPGWRGN